LNRKERNYETNGILWEVKQIMQNVLKVWYISLLSKYVKLISGSVLLCAFACASRGHL